jgi:hypothetical protein
MLAPSSSSSGDRKRGEAGRGGSPLVEPSGAPMSVFLSASVGLSSTLARRDRGQSTFGVPLA